MEFKVTIDQFEGPLDLMLHLIKENKLDLFDLDMNVLASQYIDYIQKMEFHSQLLFVEYHLLLFEFLLINLLYLY